MQPFNYRIDVPNPQDSFVKGVQTSWAMNDRATAQQASEGAQLQNIQMQRDLSALSKNPNPTAQDYARVATKYPQLAASFKTIWEPLGEEQKQNKISSFTQTLAALKSGNIDVAKELLQQQADALRNSGKEYEAGAAEALAKTTDINPKGAADSLALLLSSAMGDKFSPVYDSLSKTPVEVEQKQLENANLPIKQRLDNQNAFEDVETKKLERQISVLDSKIKAADSDTKREELQLKRDELIATKEQKSQEKQTDAQTKLDMVNTSLDAVNKVFKHPELEMDPISRSVRAMVPGTDAVDFISLIDTVKSQQFMDNISKMKSSGGTGALSDAEGKKLDSLIGNLDPRQSNTALKNSLGQIKTTLERAQQRAIAQGNLPTSNKAGGNTYVMQHPKYGVITDSVINSLLTQKPGMTKEQALQFFKDSGGK
jgi:hypothetical protein